MYFSLRSEKYIDNDEKYEKYYKKVSDFLLSIDADKKYLRGITFLNHSLENYKFAKEKTNSTMIAVVAGLYGMFRKTMYSKNIFLQIQDIRIQRLFGDEVDRLLRLYTRFHQANIGEKEHEQIDLSDYYVIKWVQYVNIHSNDKNDETTFIKEYNDYLLTNPNFVKDLDSKLL